MYQKAKNSWIKHIDFVILDILCLQVSFFLAYLVRHRNLNLYSNSVYGNLAIVLILIDVCMMFFLNTCKNVLKRGLLIELAATTSGQPGDTVCRVLSVLCERCG